MKVGNKEEMPDLRFDVSEIIEHPGAEKEFAGELSVDTVKMADRKVAFVCPVKVSGLFRHVGHGILAIGKFEGIASLECSRCLDEYELEIGGDFEELFLLNPAVDSGETQTVNAGMIDLEKPVYELLITEVPFKPLCREDCAGICQVCGKNKNIHPHVCQEEHLDIRMTKLKEFLDKQREG